MSLWDGVGLKLGQPAFPECPPGQGSRGEALPKDPATLPPSLPPTAREGQLRLPESRLGLGRSRRGKGGLSPERSGCSRESRPGGRGSWGRARWSRGLRPERRLGAPCTP